MKTFFVLFAVVAFVQISFASLEEDEDESSYYLEAVPVKNENAEVPIEVVEKVVEEAVDEIVELSYWDQLLSFWQNNVQGTIDNIVNGVGSFIGGIGEAIFGGGKDEEGYVGDEPVEPENEVQEEHLGHVAAEHEDIIGKVEVPTEGEEEEGNEER